VSEQKNQDELGALWSKSGAAGEYLTGEINGVKVVCFRNKKAADNPKAPTWRVLKSKPREAVNSDDIAF
jgi:hypothetical protein